MSDKPFVKLLSGYETDSEDGYGGKRFFCRKISGNATRVAKNKMLRNFLGGAAVFGRRLAYSSTRAYGAFFMGFGLIAMLTVLVKDYLGFYESLPISSVIVGAIFALIGIGFVVTDNPLCVATQRFALTDLIFFEFFCLKRLGEDPDEKGISPVFALIVGMLIALPSAFIPAIYLAIGIGVCAYLILSFSSPEFSLFFGFLVMPYISVIRVDSRLMLCLLVGVTLVSFFSKVLVGKRVFFFEQYDALLLLFNLPILLSGIFLKGVLSFESSLIMLILSTGYIVTGSLITNRRIANYVISAIIVSSLPVSCIAAMEFFLKAGTPGFVGSSATFSDPSELATFLLLVATCCVYFVFSRGKRSAKVIYFSFLALTLLALGLSKCMWAFVAALIGVGIYGLTKLARFSGFFVALISLLPYGVPLLGRDLLMRIAHHPHFASFNFGFNVNLWEVGLSIFKDHFLTGVGIGAQSFAEEYEKYASTGGVYENCGNFLIQLGCEAGVFTLAILILIFAVRLRHSASYLPYVKHTQLGELSCFCTCAIAILFVFGAFTYVFSDITMYYLFWCVFGIGAAALRVSRQEFDDRVGYFKDEASSQSSSVDIYIKQK